LRVKILGGKGGVTKTDFATSFLIDDHLLLDAGSVASNLELNGQVKVSHILISHAHLDHTKDLGFLCDNCFGQKNEPFQVFSHPTVLKAIKDHLFNEIIWPDFSLLPSKEKPTISFFPFQSEEPFSLKTTFGEYHILPIPVTHPGDAHGFIITHQGESLLFTQDTGPTDLIWHYAHKTPNLKAIFTEVSFPNHLHHVAKLSDHHTPDTLLGEMAQMPKDIPIYISHLKPNFLELLIQEINSLESSRLVIIHQDGIEYSF
jgi:ribonuclease BN (tRNA processing enzyme)